MDYAEFLKKKALDNPPTGLEGPFKINKRLFPFQRDSVEWALKRGRAAIWFECGTGKTPIQLEWARLVSASRGCRVLILAPLAVAEQTVREGHKFGIQVQQSRDGSWSDDLHKIIVTNYERLHHFKPEDFGAIVLDESGILKGFNGKFRKSITKFASSIPFRLACTATPAPNDLLELANHAEFLDVMSGKEIIALFFVQDGNTTHKWRLKGHAIEPFYKWLATWALALRKPSDLGYEDDGFKLPTLEIKHDVVKVPVQRGLLFPKEAHTMGERLTARRESIDERVAMCIKIISKEPQETWLVWCNLNAESHAVAKAVPDAIEIFGSQDIDEKERLLNAFATGAERVLVTKPSIAGHGLNLQHCARQVFLGLSDSWEQYYQAVRRCWRFGQKRPVEVHVITAETEGAVVANIRRKEVQATKMLDNLVKHMAIHTDIKAQQHERETYMMDNAKGEGWQLLLGDCVERIKEIPDESIGLSVFSPPFPGMYAYTNSPRDIGNTREIVDFMRHFSYLIPDLIRVTMPGRMCCIHLMQLTAMKSRDGYIGLKDYRGRVIKMMESNDWPYAGEVTIDKNPQIQATRNKERGLLFKSLSRDSSMMRMALADYILYFRKPGENPKPIHAGISKRYGTLNGWITEDEWIEWAAPVWYRQTKHYPGGIRETDVLNTRVAKDKDDEKHICPLQLGVIERCVKLWSAPGETVFSPFAGIGSEGYQALKLGRKFIGIELKESYYKTALDNLKCAEKHTHERSLLSTLEDNK